MCPAHGRGPPCDRLSCRDDRELTLRDEGIEVGANLMGAYAVGPSRDVERFREIHRRDAHIALSEQHLDVGRRRLVGE